MLPIHSHHRQAVPSERLELNAAEKRLLAAEEEARGCRLQEMRKLPLYDMCFACGEANLIGLHLHFFLLPGEDGCLAFFTPRPEHQSYNGRMHGGLITVLLDEIMGNYLFMKEGTPAYTARIDLRFREPVRIGATIRCVGRETKRKGRLVVMEGQIVTEDGTVAAEAVSHMMLEKEQPK
ncbi:MAG: PaaI family thioesterase [Selenomonadales bacterium]|nr:PaaI family thioesterase [Selenomonadales bacterium]